MYLNLRSTKKKTITSTIKHYGILKYGESFRYHAIVSFSARKSASHLWFIALHHHHHSINAILIYMPSKRHTHTMLRHLSQKKKKYRGKPSIRSKWVRECVCMRCYRLSFFFLFLFYCYFISIVCLTGSMCQVTNRCYCCWFLLHNSAFEAVVNVKAELY